MKRFFMKYIKDESGQDLVEYSLLLALVAVAAVITMTTLGSTLSSTFTTITGKL